MEHDFSGMSNVSWSIRGAIVACVIWVTCCGLKYWENLSVEDMFVIWVHFPAVLGKTDNRLMSDEFSLLRALMVRSFFPQPLSNNQRKLWREFRSFPWCFRMILTIFVWVWLLFLVAQGGCVMLKSVWSQFVVFHRAIYLFPVRSTHLHI